MYPNVVMVAMMRDGKILLDTFECVCDGEPCEGVSLPGADVEPGTKPRDTARMLVTQRYALHADRVVLLRPHSARRRDGITGISTCIAEVAPGPASRGTWMDPIRLWETAPETGSRESVAQILAHIENQQATHKEPPSMDTNTAPEPDAASIAAAMAQWTAKLTYKHGSLSHLATLAAWEHSATGAITAMRTTLDSIPVGLIHAAAQIGDPDQVDGAALERAWRGPAVPSETDTAHVLRWTTGAVHRAHERGEDTPRWAMALIERTAHSARDRRDSPPLAIALAAIGRHDDAGEHLAQQVQSAPAWYPNMADNDEDANAALHATAQALTDAGLSLRAGDIAKARALSTPVINAISARSERLGPRGEDAVTTALVLTHAMAGDPAGAVAVAEKDGLHSGFDHALSAAEALPGDAGPAQVEAALEGGYRALKGLTHSPSHIARIARVETTLYGAVSHTVRTLATQSIGALAALATITMIHGTGDEATATLTMRLERAQSTRAKEAITHAAQSLKRSAAAALEAALRDPARGAQAGVLIDAIARHASSFPPRTAIAIKRMQAQYTENVPGDDNRAQALYGEAIAEAAALEDYTFHGPPEWTPRQIGPAPVRTDAAAGAYEEHAGTMTETQRERSLAALCPLIHAGANATRALATITALHTCTAPTHETVRHLASEVAKGMDPSAKTEPRGHPERKEWT